MPFADGRARASSSSPEPGAFELDALESLRLLVDDLNQKGDATESEPSPAEQV